MSHKSDKSAEQGEIFSGLFWKFGERIIAQGVSFVVSLVLARLLMPDEYGIVALVLVFINLANVFVSDGLGSALVQRLNATSKDFSTMFYCSGILSIFLYLLLFFIAPAIARFYQNPALAPVLRVLSLQVPLSAVKTIQHAYVQRHMIFKKFFWSTLGGTLVSGVVGIAMAYAGCGVWSLVAQYLVNSVIDTIILFITVEWHPAFEFDIHAAKEMTQYGWRLMAAQFINTFYTELQSLLIGKVYSEADLAAYNKGNQFPSLLITNINVSISSVLFPAMARSAYDPVALKALTKKSIKMSSYILFPMLAGLIAVANPLISLLLTDNWLCCVPFLQIGCIYWMFQPSQTANVQAIKASGRSDICLKLEVIKKVIGITLLLLSIRINVYAVVISNALFAGISALLNIIPNKKLIGYGIMDQLADCAPALLLSGAVFVAASFVLRFNLINIVTLALQVVIGVAVYVGGSILFKVESFYYILNMIKNHTKKL